MTSPVRPSAPGVFFFKFSIAVSTYILDLLQEESHSLHLFLVLVLSYSGIDLTYLPSFRTPVLLVLLSWYNLLQHSIHQFFIPFFSLQDVSFLFFKVCRMLQFPFSVDKFAYFSAFIFSCILLDRSQLLF